MNLTPFPAFIHAPATVRHDSQARDPPREPHQRGIAADSSSILRSAISSSVGSSSAIEGIRAPFKKAIAAKKPVRTAKR
jgi:hypothetical protein